MNVDSLTQMFQQLYRHFNERKIDSVISHMTHDVKWANGMDGGYVYGHDGVREYWTRQFSMVSSQVTPLKIDVQQDEVTIKVRQVVHNLQHELLADEVVYHFFHIQDNRIAAFDIGGKMK
ncbi:MAG TPA: nuclear transport factor 2 family protein [Chitinophagaceae bacterium]|nr:nuclear transport factor 2 family protein [Chitinophagaceae bacterium]